MTKRVCLEMLKDEIEIKREELNKLVDGGMDRDKVLKFSRELDKLIYEYYCVEKEYKKKQNVN